MRLVIAIVLASFLMPQSTWAQTTGSGYSAAKASIQQAVSNSLKANFERRQLEEWAQVSTMDKIKAYLAQPTNNLDSWIRIAQSLGIPTGTKLSPPSARDSAYCQANPTASICSAFQGEGDGGGGAGVALGWAEPSCDQNYLLDPAGNLIVPAMGLPDPWKYVYGQTLFQATTDTLLRTNNQWTALKVKLHMENNPLAEHLRYAPVYATQFCASSACTYTVYGSRLAYFGPNGTVVAGQSKAFSVGILPNSIAWSQNVSYGDPPPQDYECTNGIGAGANNQHWKSCLAAPGAWSIPTHGMVGAANIRAWSEGSAMAHCKVSEEFIRMIADAAYKAACNDGSCGAPYSKVEPEDVRNGGQSPTIRDTANVGNLPDSNTEGQPVTDPSDTPSETGPDWTDPGTQAPNPQSPTAQSIFDKAWDWGFPEIEINLGSASCPTYTAQFYTYTLTLDSHCPFIEQNRAAISALMILLFTIACGIIVLRA
ncbi:MAG: hypothetical protein QM681_14050 [Novosphingobium sp.]